MYRIPLTILLVASVLACPLRCVAPAASASESDPRQSSGCCDRCTEPASESSPVSNDDVCECTDCICQGAVYVEDSEDFDGQSESTISGRLFFYEGDVLAKWRYHNTSSRGSLTGRGARIEIQSLQL